MSCHCSTRLNGCMTASLHIDCVCPVSRFTAVHCESRNWFKFKFLGKQAGRQLLAKVFPFSHFVMTNSSKGEIDIDIAGKCLRRDINHDSHSRRGSGRGQYTNVDQSPLSGRGHVTPLDQ